MSRLTDFFRLLSILSLSACGGAEQADKSKSRVGKVSNFDEAGGQYEDAEGEQSSADFASLFRDETDFKQRELDPLTACDTLFEGIDLADEVKPWPRKIKERFVAELRRFPLTAQIEASVHGFYLIDESLFEKVDISASGLACSRRSDGKGLILINYDIFAAPPEGLQHYSVSGDHTVRYHKIDPASFTLIHEVMHAIDRKNYTDSQSGALAEVRQDIADLSWKTLQKSKYDDISIAWLSGVDPGRPPQLCALRLGGDAPSAAQGIALTGTASQEIDELQYMAEETNFLAPYAMNTAFEDFAETLTTYYYGTRRGEWPSWRVYSHELSQGLDPSSKPRYRVDAETLMRSSGKHRQKVCAMAKLVFAEDCDVTMPAGD